MGNERAQSPPSPSGAKEQILATVLGRHPCGSRGKRHRDVWAWFLSPLAGLSGGGGRFYHGSRTKPSGQVAPWATVIRRVVRAEGATFAAFPRPCLTRDQGVVFPSRTCLRA